MPRLSVVIPTCARADTLVHALRTVTDQADPELEIIVHESGRDAATAAVVAAAGDSRISHIATIEPVSMTENWERALRAASGDYVTFIGDDDGLLPDACAAATQLLAGDAIELLSWNPACYFWPQYVNPARRNRLLLHLAPPGIATVHDSQIALELLYRFRLHYSRLPMIYNSFVSRTVIERVRARDGRYFFGSAPDVISGIVNALHSSSYVVLGRPLSSSGLSHNSTGHRMYYSSDAVKRTDAIAQAFTAAERPLTTLELFIGNEMQIAKERLFPDAAPAFHESNMIWKALQSLNDTPAERSAMLAEIRAAAAAAGIEIEPWIAPPQTIDQAPADGIRAHAGTIAMDVDCSRAAIADIHGVTSLLGMLLPPIGAVEQTPLAIPLRTIEADRNFDVTFGADGNGVLFLGYGWSEPEAWGVWSLGARAEVLVPLSGVARSDLDVRVAGRMLTHEQRPNASATVVCNGLPVATFEAPHAGSVVFRLSSTDLEGGVLRLGVEMEMPRSPAEDGVSSDTRRLGFGLERVTLTCASS